MLQIRYITTMTHGWKALLVVIFVACTAQEDPIQYSAALIRYLADQSPGIFDCWIFQLSTDPEQHEAMEELLQTNKLADIPKRLIRSTNPRISIERQPKLLLIFGDYHIAALRELFALVFEPDFKESMKIIVFHQCAEKEIGRILSVFVSAKLFNVILVRTSYLQLHYTNRYRYELVARSDAVDFADLFVDQTANLAGHSLRISFDSVSMETIFSTSKEMFNGRTLEWILRTFEHINGTWEFHKRICREDEREERCFRRKRLFDAKTTFDFVLEPFTYDHVDIITFILSNVYESKIIAYMTSYPNVANPRSLEDLLQAGVVIVTDDADSYGVKIDPRFDRVFKYNPSYGSEMFDPSNTHFAYCGRSREIQFFVDHPKSHDPQTKLSRLIILDRFAIGLVVPFYFIGRRNPLRDRFRQCEIAFQEAGLMDFWSVKFLHQTFGMKYVVRLSDAAGSTGNHLGMDKLGPVCVLWIVGCGLAALVFAGEWGWVLIQIRGRIWV
ncbi:hypothetical protein pipiens_007160 [Culex pipiens pipiens]|uniref:Ionotropic receptor n=1 Tax=Culex pipiens pipiens TaxID=38569 RepID=A0ABD1DLY2_CULPP